MVNLQSLPSGLTAISNDNINYDKQKLLVIQFKLDSKIVDNCSIKRNDQVRTFICLQPEIALEKETVDINRVILFNRLIMLIKIEIERVNFLYELTD